jgi:hypothetical protein
VAQVHIQVREVLVELAYVLAVFVPVALLTVLVQSSWGCGPLQRKLFRPSSSHAKVHGDDKRYKTK